jgi:hypothetical protein
VVVVQDLICPQLRFLLLRPLPLLLLLLHCRLRLFLLVLLMLPAILPSALPLGIWPPVPARLCLGLPMRKGASSKHGGPLLLLLLLLLLLMVAL